MRDRLAERLELAAEATAIEAAGGDWTAAHIAAVLGIAKSTVYDTAWLRRIKRRAGNRGARWIPKEVRTAQAIASASRRAGSGGRPNTTPNSSFRSTFAL